MTPFLDSLNNWPSLGMSLTEQKGVLFLIPLFSLIVEAIHVWGSAVCQAQCWALGRDVQAPPRRTVAVHSGVPGLLIAHEPVLRRWATGSTHR